MVKNDPSKLSKVGPNLTVIVKFGVHLSAFRAESTFKSMPFKAKKNARILFKEL